MIKIIKNKRILFATTLLVVSNLMIFSTVLGAEGIVNCDGKDCTWASFFGAIGAIMKYIYITAFSISTLLFAYAGVLLMTSQGDTGKVTQAKDIFKNVIIGITIMFLSYWGIYMLLKGLGVDQNFYQFLQG